MNNSARTVYLTTLTSPFFVPSSAIQNHRQFGNNPEILMKSICINSSANLTQTFENSTKTKFANCAKDSLLMYLIANTSCVCLATTSIRYLYMVERGCQSLRHLFVSRIIRCCQQTLTQLCLSEYVAFLCSTSDHSTIQQSDIS